VSDSKHYLPNGAKAIYPTLAKAIEARCGVALHDTNRGARPGYKLRSTFQHINTNEKQHHQPHRTGTRDTDPQ
jgi:hypothetical protein